MALLTVPRYTIADLENFPEDGNRYELLDGVLLVTPQANIRHQIIAAQLTRQLANAVGQLGWIAGPSAIESGEATHLEPDVMIWPRRFSANLKWNEVDEHWLAVEVLSRSSKMYDREFKRDAYLRLGVREVWIVDHFNEVVEISTEPGRFVNVHDVIRWRIPGTNTIAPVDIRKIFDDVRR